MISRSKIIRRRRIVLSVCLVIWVSALIATHIPPGYVLRGGLSDKFLHAVGYFGLAAVFWMTLRVYRVDGLKRAVCVFFVMLAYAALDEITQPLVGREDSFLDWIADVGGATAALIVLELPTMWRALAKSLRKK